MRIYWGRNHIQQMEHDLIHNISFLWRPLENSTSSDKAHLSPLSFFSPVETNNTFASVDVVIPTKKYHVELYQRWLEIPEVANVIVLYNGSSNLQMHTSNRIHIEHCNWIGHGATRNLALQKIRSKYRVVKKKVSFGIFSIIKTTYDIEFFTVKTTGKVLSLSKF